MLRNVWETMGSRLDLRLFLLISRRTEANLRISALWRFSQVHVESKSQRFTLKTFVFKVLNNFFVFCLDSIGLVRATE